MKLGVLGPSHADKSFSCRQLLQLIVSDASILHIGLLVVHD